MSLRLMGCDHSAEAKAMCVECSQRLLETALERGGERDRLLLENERLKGELRALRFMVGLLIPQLKPFEIADAQKEATAAPPRAR